MELPTTVPTQSRRVPDWQTDGLSDILRHSNDSMRRVLKKYDSCRLLSLQLCFRWLWCWFACFGVCMFVCVCKIVQTLSALLYFYEKQACRYSWSLEIIFWGGGALRHWEEIFYGSKIFDRQFALKWRYSRGTKFCKVAHQCHGRFPAVTPGSIDAIL